jgi:uncharacterized protein (DUF433 family)
MSALLERDRRFSEPLYTLNEAAEYLRVAPATFKTWVRGYERERDTGPKTVGSAFIHAIDAPPSNIVGRPVLPFIGLAEGLAARALKDAGLPTHEIRSLLPRLESDIGIEYALASRRLYVEGGRLLVNYAKKLKPPEMAVFRDQQGVIADTLMDYLKLVTYDREGYAERMTLPGTDRDVVEVDPTVAFGKPILINGNARMIDILDRFGAGDEPHDIAEDFEVEADDVIEIIRAFYCRQRD